jgi:hypothetical protein
MACKPAMSGVTTRIAVMRADAEDPTADTAQSSIRARSVALPTGRAGA